MMPQRPLSVQSSFGTGQPGDSTNSKIGKVFLVGAGPGAPGLITLRGAQCLAAADSVLYDGLANPKLLELAAHAELICVGKHGSGPLRGQPLWSQNEINARLVELAQTGKRVVRLKGGDPAVFARTAEELEALTAAGIPFEVVPGITAALAAASYVGIPITHRDHASAVAFITGQQQSDPTQGLDWSALARFPGTLVLYMGVTTAGEWSQRLIAEGKAADTPAAIVRRCSWHDQRVIRCRLDEVAGQLTPASKLRPPVIVIIGPVSSLGQEFNWFDALPLRGSTVWLTRPQGQNDFLQQKLSELGAEAIELSALDIQPPTADELQKFDQALLRLKDGHYHGVALTSRRAVDALLNRLWELSLDLRALAQTKIACVGSKTAAHLELHGLRADVVPSDTYDAESLLESIATQKLVHGKRWLLPQADQARETLASGLESHGAVVDRVTAYRSVPIQELTLEIKTAMERGEVDWVTVTSPNIARTLYHLCRDYISTRDQNGPRPISLSPAISQVLEELGWPAAATARSATEEALLEALLRAAAE